jgi:hypothetical protein
VPLERRKSQIEDYGIIGNTHLLQAGLEHYPQSAMLHLRYLRELEPKWGGSFDDLEGYARALAKRYPFSIRCKPGSTGCPMPWVSADKPSSIRSEP